MARRFSGSLTWRRTFIIGFLALCILLYGNEFIFWRQTTIFISTGNNYSPHITTSNNTNNTNDDISISVSDSVSDSEDDIVYLNQDTNNLFELQKDFNLYQNPYSNIPSSIYLRHLTQNDYELFGKCIETIDSDNRYSKCILSRYILFDIINLIGNGNHGKIMSTIIHLSEYFHHYNYNLALNIKFNRNQKYAIKYSWDNDTCSTLQFEYNIMNNIQSYNTQNQYHLTNLHHIIPWIEWNSVNKFTHEIERKCLLIMEEIENVKTLEGLIHKKYPPSFKYDGGLLKFIISCYNDLMIGMNRLHLFNYYHIDINGVNILTYPRYNITNKRICYLIDFGGIFSMDFDSKTSKLFTGKSHNYSPFAYYYLFNDKLRENATNFNLTLLNYYGVMDNQYRIIVELLNVYYEYIELEKNISFTDNEYKYIENIKEIQDDIIHVTPVGINPSNSTYIQYIWCLRQIQINLLRKSNLGSKSTQIYKQKQKNQLFKLLDILENDVKETNAINDELCTRLMKTGYK